RLSERPDSLDLWQERLGEIYRGYLEAVSLERVVLELLTQMGEVSDAMVRIYTYETEEFVAPEPTWQRRRLEEELGDLFRWLFLVVEKLDAVIALSSIQGLVKSLPRPLRLSWIIWHRYGSPNRGQLHCPFCRSTR